MKDTIRMLVTVTPPEGDERSPMDICREVTSSLSVGLALTDRATVNLIGPNGDVLDPAAHWRLVAADENDDQLSADQLDARVLTHAGNLGRLAREEADRGDEDKFPIDMERVAELVRTVHGIRNAFVENTGGGTACILAGPIRDEPNYGPRYAAIAGPGTYRHGDPRQPFGDLSDFAVGPDDDGQASPIRPPLTATPELLAALIATQAKLADPSQALGADDLERLGLDPGLRGPVKLTSPEYTED